MGVRAPAPGRQTHIHTDTLILKTHTRTLTHTHTQFVLIAEVSVVLSFDGRIFKSKANTVTFRLFPGASDPQGRVRLPSARKPLDEQRWAQTGLKDQAWDLFQAFRHEQTLTCPPLA